MLITGLTMDAENVMALFQLIVIRFTPMKTNNNDEAKRYDDTKTRNAANTCTIMDTIMLELC